ncbi:umecyanin [Salix suchowensis]|nr:umecyanin [Salix suchowensis]
MRNLIVFVVLGAVSLLLRNSEAVTYEVGDSTRWTRPSNSSVYSDWASDKTFAIGDTLIITIIATDQSKHLVSAGPASVLLNTTGDYYFICTIAGHCSAGQKLAITVAAGSTPSPPGTPSSPPPPPPSAASSLVATFALVFMSIAISFMYFF